MNKRNIPKDKEDRRITAEWVPSGQSSQAQRPKNSKQGWEREAEINRIVDSAFEASVAGGFALAGVIGIVAIIALPFVNFPQ